MLRSTFASFTTAQLAIQANQNALAVVGQNIANVKTEGYTRQRLDQISLNLKGPSNLYQVIPDAHIGFGVQVTGVSQIRDPFLDVRYRMELSGIGTVDKRLETMNNLASVLDDTNKTALNDQFDDLFSQLEKMEINKGTDGFDSMVRSSAQVITNTLHTFSEKLANIRNNSIEDLNNDVSDLNSILRDIQELTVSIKNSQVNGNPALEQQDTRNQLIDQLATYADIKVTHDVDVTITGTEIDVLRIDLVRPEGNVRLIDDTKPPAEFSVTAPDEDHDGFGVSVTDYRGFPYENAETGNGVLKGALNMLNDEGSYETNDPEASRIRGIGYYQKALDSLANVFAKTFNDLNTVKDEDGNILRGGPLFETSDGSDTITAENINIAQKWISGEVGILQSRAENPASNDQTNVINLKSALRNDQVFTNEAGNVVYQGSFTGFVANTITTLGADQKATGNTLNNFIGIANDIADSKDSVSGVNINEEAMNMLQFNDALNAASRYMTTLDEALNTIINSMGVVGR